DYTAIVKSAESRRVTPFAPEESLILQKPTLTVTHGGGRRMEVGSDAYYRLLPWLGEGGPRARNDHPRPAGPPGFSRPPGVRGGAGTARVGHGCLERRKFD